MKRTFFVTMFLLSAVQLLAEKDVKFFMNSGEVKCVAQERIDSISFDEENDILLVALLDGRSESLALSAIDSISYGRLPETVIVNYETESAVVENPFAFDNVAVKIDGAKVTVVSTSGEEVGYTLQGSSDDGCFKIYGEVKYNLYLNGVELSNSCGAAINSQCSKRGRVFIVGGTENSLSDSSEYSTLQGEDEKGALFSEGQLIFEGSGKLTVNANYKHAICSDDYIELRSGNITVASATGDAVHVNDSIIVLGGTMSLTACGDGIDCDGPVRLFGGNVDVTAMSEDVKGIKSASSVEIDGAAVTVTVGGNASKGIKCNGLFAMSAGTLAVDATGNTVLMVGDPSYATCIKSDSSVIVTGGTLVLKATGIAGRGISADCDIVIANGTTTIECSGSSETYDPTAAGDILGGEEEEPRESYVVYVSIPASTTGNRPDGSSSAWSTIYLYDSSNSLVATLASSVVLNGTIFYYYDFGSEVTGSYYFKSNDYRSGRTTYSIQSSSFTGLESDTYYQISSSYTTSGSVRTYSLGDVTSSYEGGSASSGSATEDSYAAAGIKCDRNFTLSGGAHIITMSGSESKGIKVEGNAVIDGGTLAINTSGAARIVAYDPSYCTAIKCDSALTINGGDVDIVATGQGGHGISADGVLTMNGGDVSIIISGDGSSYTTSTGTDYYSTKCLKGDVAVNLLGGKLDCLAKGNGSKAIVAGGLLTIGKEGAPDDELVISAVTEGSSLAVSSGSTGGGWGGMGGGMQEGFNAAPKAIKGASNVVVNSGTLYAETANDGGEGLESKATLTINGGIIECNTYDDGINASSALVFNGGYVYSHASNNDGIDSNGTITVNGGVVLASGTNAPEEGFDCDNNQFVVNGGILVGSGSANSSVTSSSQPYALVSSVSVSQGKYLCVKDASGNVLFSYKCPNTVNGAAVLLSSPDFTTSSHTLVYGATSVSGTGAGFFNGVFTVGGTVTGGTSKSFTPQTK